MKYSNQYGTVDLWPEELHQLDEVIIMMSGGADSTIMTYLFCKGIMDQGLDIKVHTQTLVAEEKFANVHAVLDIRNWMMKEYPDINWGEHEFYYYSENEEPVKQVAHRRATTQLREKTGATLLISSRTANPPLAEAEKHDLIYQREEIRDVEDKEVAMIKYAGDELRWFGPLQKVDKRWVAEMYRQYDIEELSHMTASCIGWAYETEFFTKACRHCWWCREKLWAFGYYDGGETPDQEPAQLPEGRVWKRALPSEGCTQSCEHEPASE